MYKKGDNLRVEMSVGYTLVSGGWNVVAISGQEINVIGYGGAPYMPHVEGAHLSQVIQSKELLNKIDVESKDFERLVKVIQKYGSNIQMLKKEMKATELITESKFLTDEEFEELINENHITIQSKKHPERKYVVSENSYNRVIVKEDGKAICTLCTIPTTNDNTENHEAFTDIDKFINRFMAVKNDEDYMIDNSNVYMEPGFKKEFTRADLKNKSNLSLPEKQGIIAKMFN